MESCYESFGRPISTGSLADPWPRAMESISLGDRGWPETWPTHGIMPCKSCHPFAPYFPGRPRLAVNLARPMSSCLVIRVTHSPSYIRGRPRLARSLTDICHHAMYMSPSTSPCDLGRPVTWPAIGPMACKSCRPVAPCIPG